jgi:hypothetical protein
LRKRLGRFRRSPQRVQGELIGSRRAAKPEVDSARKQSRERSELLGDNVRRVVGKHDAARPDPDGRRPLGEMSEHNRRRGAGDARHIVMFGDPDAPIAPLLRAGGEVAGVVQRAAGVGLLRDANKLENG